MLAKAQWSLRSAQQVPFRVRLMGRAVVRNEGTLLLGNRVRLHGSTAPISLTTGPDGTIEIGTSTFVNHGTMIAATERVSIGDSCQIGTYCLISDHEQPEENVASGEFSRRAISIGDNVWLGARVIVLPGVTIGDGSAIGAGSVVDRDIPPRTLAVGVPATPIRQL